MAFIYGLFDPRKSLDSINCRYVGQTTTPLNKRLNRHVGSARTTAKKHRHVNRWILSLLNDGVRPVIVLIEEFPESDLDEAEKSWIAYARAFGCDLTNYQDGGRNNMLRPGAKDKVGAGHRGQKLTDDHKAKISASHMGISHTLEIRQQISEKLTGRKNGPPSEETRRKISESQKGKIITDEQRALMSESGTRRFAEPGAREAYSELMSGVMADPEIRKRISDGQKIRHAARDKSPVDCPDCGNGPFNGELGLSAHKKFCKVPR